MKLYFKLNDYSSPSMVFLANQFCQATLVVSNLINTLMPHVLVDGTLKTTSMTSAESQFLAVHDVETCGMAFGVDVQKELSLSSSSRPNEAGICMAITASSPERK